MSQRLTNQDLMIWCKKAMIILARNFKWDTFAKKIMTMQERKKRNLMRFAKHFMRIPFDLWILHYLSRKDICSSALFKRWVESMKRRLSFLHVWYRVFQQVLVKILEFWNFLSKKSVKLKGDLHCLTRM